MTGTGESDTLSAPKKGSRFVPKRPKPPRDELLGALKANEPISMGELHDALEDGRLSQQEARDLVPGWRQMEESTREMAEAMSGDRLIKALGLDSIDKVQEQWRQQLKSITDSVRLTTAVPSIPASAFKNPQLEALRALRADIGTVAKILETSGDQIGLTAKLAATTVTSLDRVHGETKALRDDLRESNNTITRLTWGLFSLGVVTAGLTGVLVWLTWVLTHQH